MKLKAKLGAVEIEVEGTCEEIDAVIHRLKEEGETYKPRYDANLLM